MKEFFAGWAIAILSIGLMFTIFVGEEEGTESVDISTDLSFDLGESFLVSLWGNVKENISGSESAPPTDAPPTE